MNVFYYSYYPYANPAMRIVKHPNNPNCDAITGVKYRMYYASKCTLRAPHYSSYKEILDVCYEAMDSAIYEVDVKANPTGFIVDNVEIFPSKHFYGATNIADGIYIIDDNHFFVKSLEGWEHFNRWIDAFEYCKNHNRASIMYLDGIDSRYPIQDMQKTTDYYYNVMESLAYARAIDIIDSGELYEYPERERLHCGLNTIYDSRVVEYVTTILSRKTSKIL